MDVVILPGVILACVRRAGRRGALARAAAGGALAARWRRPRQKAASE